MTDQRLALGRVVDRVVLRMHLGRAFLQLRMHGRGDVAASDYRTQHPFQIVGEPEAAFPLVGRQPHPRERAEARGAQPLLDAIAMPGGYQPVDLAREQQPAVDAGEPLLPDLAPTPLDNLPVGTRSKIEIDQLRCPRGEPSANIFAGDDQILTAIIDATHQNMGMRMAGIEMVDGDPIELRAKVLLDLRHPAPH